jgi:hypothetical protein
LRVTSPTQSHQASRFCPYFKPLTYLTGSVEKKLAVIIIDNDILLSITTRYFSDSGIIGTNEFVSINYQRFKHIFQSKHEKKPKPIKGLDGVYSLKRLAEA